jgi:hypothetical protein
MATTMSGSIDLDKPAKYPVVLSDALMGRGSKEIFTSIRCKIKHYPPLFGMLIGAPCQITTSLYCLPKQL